MSRRMFAATFLAVATLAGAMRAARADEPPPQPPPDDGSGSGSAADDKRDRDHDRDLDHDNAKPRNDEPKRRTTDDGNPNPDPTDHPLYSPRLVNGAKDIVVETPGERTSKNIAVLTSIASASVVTGLFGLYFHLSGRTAADAVTQTSFMGRTWSTDYQHDVDKAAKDRKLTIGFYSAGGALLVAAIVGLIATEPATTRTVIHPHVATSMIEPVPGGAVIGRGWEF